MMQRIRVVWIALVVALALLVPTAPALASDGEPPGIVIGQSFTLRSGEVMRGDLVVIGGSVTLEADSRVKGSVIVWGGSVVVSGEVDGDVTVMGGSVDVSATAEVDGTVSIMGGSISTAEGAYIGGGVQRVFGPGFDGDRWQRFGPWRTMPHMGQFGGYRGGNIVLGLLLRVGRLILLTLLMALLSGLVAVLWPQQALRAGVTAIESLLPAFGVGLGTFVAAVVVTLGLIVTVCLAPVGVLVALAVGITALFGWLTLGIYVGHRLIPQGIPFWTGALGAGLLTLLSGLVELIPCVGWILPFLVICVGLGAVVLTRFGTTIYPTAHLPAPVKEPSPAPLRKERPTRSAAARAEEQADEGE